MNLRKWSLDKVMVSHDPPILILRWRLAGSQGYEKVYTVSQLLASGVDHSLSKVKPAFAAVENSMIARMIKIHLLGKTCLGWAELSEGKIWSFVTGPERTPIGLVWHHEKPSMLELVVANTSLFRFSAKGIYTKKKDFSWREAAAWSNLAEIFSPIGAQPQLDPRSAVGGDDKNASQNSSPEPDSDQLPQPSGMAVEEQAALKRKLKRRLKTLKKTLAKLREDSHFIQELARLGAELKFLQSYGYTLEQNHFGKLSLIPRSDAEPMPLDLSESATLGEAIEKRGRSLQILKAQSFHEREQRGKVMHNIRQIEDALAQRIPLQSVLGSWSGRNDANGSKKESGPTEARLPWYLYRFGDTDVILVGRSSAENDLLTKKAKSNDLWFHVLGGKGSHVVLPHRPKRSPATETQLKHYAAILAIHHSPSRADRRGEVNIARREHLRKPKGFPPGKWLVQRSETLFLAYEEPDLQLVLEARA